MVKKLLSWIQRMEQHVDSAWYPFALIGVGLLDNFIYVIPLIPILITSVFAAPRKWIPTTMGLVAGAFLGSLIFAFLVSHYGISLIEYVAPSLIQGEIWLKCEEWVKLYGIWTLWFVAVLPITDQPAIAIVALSKISILQMGWALFFGKAAKYFLIGWLASHAPKVLLRFKKLREEVNEISPEDTH